MTSPTPSLPAAIREALDAYELACYRHQARQVLETFAEATAVRRALEAHLLALVARTDEAERERDDWRTLAMKSGHYVTAELEKHTGILTASIKVSTELIALSKCDAITEACYKLAREMRATYKAVTERHAARTPPEDTTRDE